MNARKKRRLAFAAALLAAGGVLAGVIVYGLGQNTMYFRSPTDIADKQVSEGVAFRLGGLVEKGSVHHGAGADVHFRVTDGKSTVAGRLQWRAAGPVPRRPGRGRHRRDGRQRHLCRQRSAGQAR